MQERSQIDFHKSLFIKTRIKELQALNPERSFADCWRQLQREHPDWMMSDQPGWDPETSDEFGVLRETNRNLFEDPPGQVLQPHVRSWHEQPPRSWT